MRRAIATGEAELLARWLPFCCGREERSFSLRDTPRHIPTGEAELLVLKPAAGYGGHGIEVYVDRTTECILFLFHKLHSVIRETDSYHSLLLADMVDVQSLHHN